MEIDIKNISFESLVEKDRKIKSTENTFLSQQNYAAGFPPFLRGPYSSMYVNQPWTIYN